LPSAPLQTRGTGRPQFPTRSSIVSLFGCETCPCARLPAPRFGGGRTTRLPADKRNSEVFANQDSANIAAIGFENAATPSVIAEWGSLSSRRTRTRDKLKVEFARSHQVANSRRRSITQGPLNIALRPPRFRRVKADQTNIRLLVMNSNGVAIYYAHVIGVDWKRCQQPQGREGPD